MLSPMQRYFARVAKWYKNNAERVKPLRMNVMSLDSTLDVVQCAYAEYVVPAGTVSGNRAPLGMLTEKRIKCYNDMCDLEFVGYTHISGRDYDRIMKKKIAVAHFKDRFGNSYYCKRGLFDVFGMVATHYYFQPRGQFITLTTDDAECVLGNICTMKGGET